MATYTVNSTQTLIVASDPTTLLPDITGSTGMQVQPGDTVTVADPPVTLGSYTQITTNSGVVGWVPTSSISAGLAGSTAMNLGLLAVLGAAFWFLFLRRGK